MVLCFFGTFQGLFVIGRVKVNVTSCTFWVIIFPYSGGIFGVCHTTGFVFTIGHVGDKGVVIFTHLTSGLVRNFTGYWVSHCTGVVHYCRTSSFVLIVVVCRTGVNFYFVTCRQTGLLFGTFTGLFRRVGNVINVRFVCSFHRSFGTSFVDMFQKVVGVEGCTYRPFCSSYIMCVTSFNTIWGFGTLHSVIVIVVFGLLFWVEFQVYVFCSLRGLFYGVLFFRCFFVRLGSVTFLVYHVHMGVNSTGRGSGEYISFQTGGDRHLFSTLF